MNSALAFYDEHFAQLMRLQPQAYLEQVCRFLWQETALKTGARVLDQGCGIGRISLALAQTGLEVTGIDQNPAYIAEARRLKTHHPLTLHFELADARHYTSPQPCDLVLSWHTSFGHHVQDQDNLALLQTAYHSIKAGGYLILDYANFHYTRRYFQPCLKQNYPLPDGNVLKVWRHSQLDEVQGLLKQRWEFRYPDGQIHQKHGQICSYTPEKLEQLLRKVGFTLEHCSSDLSGRPFYRNSPRWIGRARKVPLQEPHHKEFSDV